jgi:hypothetical protein
MHIYVLRLFREALPVPSEAAACTQGVVDEEDVKSSTTRKYCDCKRVSLGKMVACDNPKVSRFSCINIA